MQTWLDRLLWRLSRRYRRRKIKHSRVRAELLQPVPRDTRMLDRYLERPAILARGRISFAQDNPLLVEKLADEAITRGQAMEYWCEHCPQYGECCVCGQTHDRAGGV